MAEDKSQDVDQSGENWLSSFEEECLEDLDREPNMEDRIQAEREFSTQKLWLGFQNSASCIAQLYKGKNVIQGCNYLLLRTCSCMCWVT